MGAFPKQFLLAERQFDLPYDWNMINVGRFVLHHAPDLPIYRVDGIQAEVAGVLLGWPISLMVDPKSDVNFWELSGRWAFISDEGQVQMDPLGSYSIVYSPELRLVGSSTGVFPAGLLQSDEALNRALDLPAKDHWYPFGLTPYSNAKRLLPHHHLDLNTYAVKRVAAPFQIDRVENPLAKIALNLRCQLDSLKQQFPLTVGLTAGNESRMLLAGLKYPSDTCHFFTIGRPGENQDVRTARALAKRFNLQHDLLPRMRNSKEESLWSNRVGHCVAGATLQNAKTKTQLRQDSIILKGIGGEVGRGGYYREGDETRTTLEPDELIRRLGLPRTEKIRETASQWLRGLSFDGLSQLFAFLHIENRVGCWQHPSYMGTSLTGPVSGR